MVQRYDLYLKIQSFWAIFMVYHGGTDANQNSGVGENNHILQPLSYVFYCRITAYRVM